MKIILVALVFISTALCAAQPASPQPLPAAPTTPTATESKHPKLHFFSGLWSNIGDTISGTNLLFWAAVPVTTVGLVHSNTDEAVNTYLARNRVWSPGTDFFFLQVGNFAQALPPAFMFIYGYFWNDREMGAAGAAALQALGVNGGVVITLKWVSGRPRPQYDPQLGFTPHDKDFNFDITKQSTTSDRWRWPSGHTSSTFAVAGAYAGFYPHKAWVKWVVYPIAALMGFAMLHAPYHWASDVVAGALIGHVVGYTTGRNFRRMYEGYDVKADVKHGADRKLDWFLAPRNTESGLAIALSAAF